MSTLPLPKRTAPNRTVIWGLGITVALVGVMAIAAVAYFAKASALRKVHARSDPTSSDYRPPSVSQVAALKLEYPKPGPETPKSISVIYNAHKDRTRMTLELKEAVGGLAGAATFASAFLVIEMIPHFVWHQMTGDSGGPVAWPGWVALAVLSWLMIGIGAGIVCVILPPLRRLVLLPLQRLPAGLLRMLGMQRAAAFWWVPPT